jgi:hypothetical protein
VISSPAGKLGLGSVYNTIQHYKYIHYFLMWLFNSYYAVMLNVAVIDRICQEKRDNICSVGTESAFRRSLELKFSSTPSFFFREFSVKKEKTDPSVDFSAPRKLSIYSYSYYTRQADVLRVCLIHLSVSFLSCLVRYLWDIPLLMTSTYLGSANQGAIPDLFRKS